MFFLLLALFTLLFYLMISILQTRKHDYEARIRQFLPRNGVVPAAADDEKQTPKARKSFGKHLVSAIGRNFEGKTFLEKWREKLEQAGIKLKPEEFFALKLIIPVIMVTIGWLLGYTMIFVILLAAVGFYAPNIHVKRKRDKRLQKVGKQLPNTLGTMASALKAGFSFLQAMQLVGKEIPDPIGPEFNRVLREINLGVSFEEAFGQLLKRLPNDDLEMVTNALLVQRTTGGNLADILESVQDTIRERVRIKDELKALTAQGKMSAWVITLLPLILALLLNMMNREYFSPMLKHPLGWGLLLAGSVSGLMGWVFIQKIIKIEV